MPFGLLRWMIGALCIFFSPAFGRSVIRFRQGRERQTQLLGWALRCIVTGAAVSFRAGFDVTTMVVYLLALLAFSAGAYFEARPRQDDELEKIMFPRD